MLGPLLVCVGMDWFGHQGSGAPASFSIEAR